MLKRIFVLYVKEILMGVGIFGNGWPAPKHSGKIFMSLLHCVIHVIFWGVLGLVDGAYVQIMEG